LKDKVTKIDRLFNGVEVTAVREIIIELSMVEKTSNQREVLASLSENENNFFEEMITTAALFLCISFSTLFA
jgi:hypothetical protein